MSWYTTISHVDSTFAWRKIDSNLWGVNGNYAVYVRITDSYATRSFFAVSFSTYGPLYGRFDWKESNFYSMWRTFDQVLLV